MKQPNQRIAVVGSGAAGLSAAWLLQQKYDVSVYEQDARVGGHVHTVEVPAGPDAGLPVDTGFIVFNDRNYPTLLRIFDALNVPYAPSDMSFSFSDRSSGFEYCGSSLSALFADRKNLFRPRFHRLIRDILRFNREALAFADKPEPSPALSLGDFLASQRFSSDLTHRYVVPMGAAIWSSSFEDMLAYPAATFIRFFRNHGLLELKNRPQWYFVEDGSHQWVNRLRNTLEGPVHASRRVARVAPLNDQSGASLHFEDGSTSDFDVVVVATHADQAYKLLHAPTPNQQRLLAPWRYSRNRALLHTDNSLMPARTRAWASWNALQPDDPTAPVSLTYHMNRLQNLDASMDYFVTLNPVEDPRDDTILREIEYTHPLFTAESVATQNELSQLNEKGPIRFCGSYFRYGFHEDAVLSGTQAAQSLGVTW